MHTSQFHCRCLFPALMAKSRFCSSGPAGCNPGAPAKGKALKFPFLSGGIPEKVLADSLDERFTTGAVPRAEETEGDACNETSDCSTPVADNGVKSGTHKLEEDARNVAIGFLAARAITVAELRKKLRGRNYPHDVIDSVVAYLCNRGFVNDGLYAESFSRSRWLTCTWGPRRIKKALLDKGISAEDADRATSWLFEVGTSGASGQSISKLSMDHLLSRASKQWVKYQNKPLENRKSCIIRWLQYRGFDWSTIMVVLNRLGCERSP